MALDDQTGRGLRGAGSRGLGDSSSSTRKAETTVARRRERTVTTWKKGKGGKMPWSPAKVGAFAAVPMVGALLIGGTAWAVPSIENKLERQTIAELQAAGVDTSNLDVNFSYRNGTITGSVAGMSDGSSLVASGDSDGVRSLQAVLDAPEPEPAEQPTTTVPAQEEVAIETGPTEVEAILDGDRIVLRGEVLSEAHRQTLVEAAESTGREVVDELTVSGFDQATPGADARVAGLAGLLSAVGSGSTGVASLTDTTLGFVGEAANAEAAADLEGALESAGGGVESSSEIVISATDQGEVLAARLAELGPILFATDSAALDADAVALLDRAVAVLSEFGDPQVRVVGHTDSRGVDPQNQALSERRAKSVVEYLVDNGVAADRLTPLGMGEGDPAADNGTPQGLQENRRVVFQVTRG